jgi:thiol-disulfide isomerase/thioredoxin
MIAQKLTVLTVLAFVACAAILAGVSCKAQQYSPQQPVTQASVTMADVDNALANGPVFLEFETSECSYCKQQHPISQQLQSDYAGKVTFFFVDANENRDLARTFQVVSVPQMDIIASKSGSTYTYVDRNGNPSSSIGSSKILGLTQKDTLTQVLNAAVQMKK